MMDTREAAQSAEEITRKAEKGFESARDAARERLNQANEQYETFSSNARRDAEATWERTIDLIQENPVSALGIALLVGAGVGALITAWAKD
jgi:ElaB/YqjD/DUF883 family membrane-anchored ribosome-binding protein